jgi:Ca2+-dependent lipid-binding protein
LSHLPKVISAWQLPKSANPKSQKLRKGEVSDPYVRIIMSGVSLDCKKEKTSVISNNGFNPVWQQQFTFELRDPELAVLMFEVYNSDSFSKNDFLGYAGMPVRLLKRGYRHVQLKAKDRSILNEACLMIHIELEDLKQSS